MTTTNTYLAICLGNSNSPRVAAWMAMPEAERRVKEQEGLAAWHAWVKQHADAIAFMGGPLGKTKQASEQGVADVSNNLSGFLVVQADSHEAAARMFENHPHFMIFPGESIEVMPVLPIPGA